MERRGAPARPDARGAILPILLIVVLAYFDWLTHRNLAVVVIGGALAVGIVLLRSMIAARLLQIPAIAQIPGPVRTIALATIPLLYFVIRGQGTSGAGAMVLVVTLAVVAGTQLFGAALDRGLAGFYAARNRILPHWLRMVLVPLFAIFVTFLLIHGSLGDIPAMFGGTTNSPATPVERQGQMLLGVLLSAIAAILLLREAPE